MEITDARISAADLHRIIRFGKRMLAQPVELLEGVREAVERGGFLQPGLPFLETARIALPDQVSPAQARKVLESAVGRVLDAV